MPYITINKTALEHNFKYFSKKVGGAEKIIVGLKDNAYGHGIEEVGSVLFECGAKHAFVRTKAEADKVSHLFESVLIIVEPFFVELPEHIHTAVSSLEILGNIPKGNSVELFVDTGMHRDGILLEEMPQALSLVKERALKLKGVFTHFATAGDDSVMVEEQEATFREAVSVVKKIWKEPFEVHCANTMGTTVVDMSKYEKCRVGIGIYGYSDFEEEQNCLNPVMALYARRLTTRTLSKGDSIGYGGQKGYTVKEDDFVVSNYDIGYGNGFFRLNERKVAQIADGRSILGRVSMDSCSVQGDDESVCIFNNARHLAKVHDTIVYEILVSLHSNIERRLV